jgi:DNA-binding FrmR family transcriptional regulator
MMDERQKEKVDARLGRIEGQIRGIRKMIGEDRYCMDIIAQLAAATAALRGVEDLVMEQHLQTCVVDAIRSNDEAQKQEKLDEVMQAIARFRKHG